MPSPFQGIDIASSALRSFQRALDVTGNNISNVNTPGYSRQTVDFSTITPTSFYGLNSVQSLGQGVGISSVNRIQDAFLAARKMASASEVGKTATYSDNLGQVESVLNETTGAGISTALDGFFNSWSALAANPNDTALQTQVQQAGQTLADRVRGAYSQLADLNVQQVNNVNSTFQSIDTITKKIGDLNAAIRGKQAAGEQPNDLMDQRDQAVQDLSKLVDIHTYTMSDGSVAVYSNQLTLVDGSGSKPYPKNFDPTTMTVSDANGTYDVHGGQLGGLFQSMNATKGYQTQLDNVANNLRTQVNALHQSGTNSLGNTGINFFNDSNPQTGATDFDLDPAVKANVKAISAGVSGVAGDGALASAISQLRNTPVAALNNQSLTDYYTGVVGQIGTDSSNAQTAVNTQTSVDTQIQNQISSVSGVSLDDEMANMLKFQRSYQAAARALSVFDQTTQDLINLIR